MGRLKAVIFDLDGTLVDSAPDLASALNHLLASERRRALALEEVIGMIGDGARVLVERAFAATGAPASDLDRLTPLFLALYEGHTADQTLAFPGVVETLQLLASADLRLAVCSNKPEGASRELLAALDLARYFDAVIGGDSLPGVRKPDPRMLMAALELLGADPQNAAMVGDNQNDVAAARAAGVPVIVRAGGYTRVPAHALGADLVIDEFRELPAALAQLS